MNVTRQEVNAETAKLIVSVSQADYQTNVTASLEKYRKQAKVPGFRPGKVPMGLIQKQYGKAVLAEEINKLVSDALYKYISENKLDILGNPIPTEGSEVKGDFNNPSDFEFEYEIGYSPAINLDLSNKSKYEYVKVKVDNDLITKQIEDLRRRYGKLVSSDTVGEKDMILAQFVELDENGEIKAGGIMHSSTTSMEFVEDKAAKKALIGKKVGDKVTISATSITRGDADKAALLGIKAEDLASHGDQYQMTINDVKVMELAELNEELFSRLFPDNSVKTEADLKEKIKADLSGMFANDSDRLLTRAIYRDLVDKTDVKLPNDFLKRWIQLSNDKPITKEQIEADYEAYSKDLKWQLIQGHIFKANDIKVDSNDALEFTKGLIVNQYAQYGIPAPEDAQLTSQAQQALTDRNEANRIYDMLAEAKLTEYFKSTVKLTEKEVSYDAFVELANS